MCEISHSGDALAVESKTLGGPDIRARGVGNQYQ